ncbi:hypothetical protein BJ742DRAFT_139280 [Cladochytrium replicatum]|nr:hypothetical protein BJ742DRAFT_139280 [Cladochytrium replicatum]
MIKPKWRTAVWIPVSSDGDQSEPDTSESSASARSSTSEPSPRVGHSTTTLHSSSLIVFAGANHEQGPLNDTYVVDCGSWIWKRIKTGRSPKARYEHSATLVQRAGKSFLLVFGGSDGVGVLNDVWILDLETYAWEEMITTGNAPAGRSLHTIANLMVGQTSDNLNKHRIYVWGGGEQGSVPVKDTAVHCLDIESGRWIQVTKAGESECPSLRLGHSIVSFCRRNEIPSWSFAVFGGMNGAHYYNDIWFFDTKRNLWTQQPTTGEAPSPRTGHAATLVDERYMLVHGGMFTGQTRTSKTTTTVLDDIFILDLVDLHWTRLDSVGYLMSGGSIPSGRLDHDMCVLKEEEISESGNELVDLVSPNTSKVFLFGGMDTKAVFNDMYILELGYSCL